MTLRPLSLLLALFSIPHSNPAADWPHFLGPDADTSVPEPGLTSDFPADGLPLAWKKPAAGGYSSPAVATGRVFLFDRIAEPYQPGEIDGNPNFIRAEIPGNERVRALDESTGETLWTHSYDRAYTTVFTYAIGPRCTPTVDGDRLYTLGAEGDLRCLSAKDGTVLWSKYFPDDYSLEVPYWGCSAHPLVHGDQLVCIVGGDGSTVVSFDKRTGEENWRALSASAPGYCPPVVATLHGVQQIIVWTGDDVVGLEPNKGTPLWSAPMKPFSGMSIGAPRIHGDLVFVMGFNGVSGAIKVAPDCRSAEVLWGPDLRKGVAGVLNTAHLDSAGHLYSGGRKGLFRCVDIRTGARLWDDPAPLKNAAGEDGGYWASVFTFPHPPSGNTYLYNDHGELIAARLSPQGYTELSRTRLIKPTHKVANRLLVWSPPAFANGHVLVRNDKEIRRYRLTDPD